MKRPNDLLAVSTAEKQTGLGRNVVAYWVSCGQVRTYGRGPRNAVLVSLAEVREAASERDAYTLDQATRLLRVESRRTRALCESGALSFTRRGDVFRIDRADVDRLAAERADVRDRFVTIEEAIAVTGWPRWVLIRLEREGTLETVPGARGSRLILRANLETLKAKLEEDPAACLVCGEPVGVGRRVHKGKCAGKLAHARTEDARVKARAIKTEDLRAFKEENALRDTREVARELDRAPRVIWRHAALLGRGALYPLGAGSTIVLFTAQDVQRIKRQIDESPTAHVHRDPRRRAKWYRARFNSTAMFGRMAKEMAAANGKKVGEPLSMTQQQVEKVYELIDKGKSQRFVADRVGVSRGSVRNLLQKRLNS
jgi:excisionase family DNA binding protein